MYPVSETIYPIKKKLPDFLAVFKTVYPVYETFVKMVSILYMDPME